MLYIKIGNDKYPADFSTFPTQKGNTAIRVKSEAPIAEGFVIVDDDDKVVTDHSDYVYLYREDGDIKEYLNVIETPVPTECYKTGVPISPIERQIQNLNNRITAITPYEQTKKAYYGEVEKVFYGVPDGVMTVLMDGDYTTQKIEDRVYIRFARLTEAKDITIMVQ